MAPTCRRVVHGDGRVPRDAVVLHLIQPWLLVLPHLCVLDLKVRGDAVPGPRGHQGLATGRLVAWICFAFFRDQERSVTSHGHTQESV